MKDRLRLLDRGYVQEYGNRLNIEMTTAKMQYKDAADRGDSDKMLEAQEKLARLNNELERHRQAKARVEREAKQPQNRRCNQHSSRNNKRSRNSSKHHSLIRKHRRGQRRMSGLEQTDCLHLRHMQYHATLVKTKGLTRTAMSIILKLIVAFVRSSLRSSRRLRNREMERLSPRAIQSASRSTKQGRRSVKLTHSQVAIAKKLGVPLEEYAKFVKE